MNKKRIVLIAVSYCIGLLFFIYNFNGGNILKAYTPLEQLIVESIKIQYRGGDTKELERIYTSDFIEQINNDPEYFYQKWILFRIDDDFMNSFSELNNNQAIVEVRVIDLRGTYFQEITLTKNSEGNYKISNILYDI